MRRILWLITTLVSVILGLWGWVLPKPRIKVPVTRYHGYNINRSSIEQAKKFTVLISNEGFEGWGRGTGVLIDSRHVLTCAHMIEGAHTDMWVFPYPASVVVKGKSVLVDEEDDLAVVEISTPVIRAHYATFQESHYDGEPITIIGNTLGSMKWFVTFGIVSGDFENYLLTDGVLYGGNSGGPWINERGEVVALTDWTLLGLDGKELDIHGGVEAASINTFLKSWKSPSISQILQIMIGNSKHHSDKKP
jgi:S1-C subfamily serine protease